MGRDFIVSRHISDRERVSTSKQHEQREGEAAMDGQSPETFNDFAHEFGYAFEQSDPFDSPTRQTKRFWRGLVD